MKPILTEAQLKDNPGLEMALKTLRDIHKIPVFIPKKKETDVNTDRPSTTEVPEPGDVVP